MHKIERDRKVKRMPSQLISLPSITYANKAKSYLAQYGIQSTVIKTPKSLRKRGCGYSLRVNQDGGQVASLLQQAGFELLD